MCDGGHCGLRSEGAESGRPPRGLCWASMPGRRKQPAREVRLLCIYLSILLLGVVPFHFSSNGSLSPRLAFLFMLLCV